MVGQYTRLVPFKWRLAKNGSYQRIDRRGIFSRRPKAQRLGSRRSSKRTWRLKMPKIKIRIVSPLTLLARLRDAYVNLMMSLAGRGNMAGMAMGPVGGGSSLPCRKVESKLFTDAELVYLEKLKRDQDLMQVGHFNAGPWFAL